jgi:hypothetical protein
LEGGQYLVYNIGWHESEFWDGVFLYLLQSIVVARLGKRFCVLVRPGRLLCVFVIVMEFPQLQKHIEGNLA